MAKPLSRSYSRYARAATALLGKLIRERRINAAITTTELATRAGISRDLLHRIERGDPACSIGAAFVEIALKRTYMATPNPKIVVSVGDCGCDGGIFGESYASLGGIGNVIPVDAHIPGCPPAPTDLLRGILTVIER